MTARGTYRGPTPAYAGLREWVQQVAAGDAGTTVAAARPFAATQPAQASRGLPGWAIALIVAVPLVLIVGIFVAIAIPMKLSQDNKARESSVKEGIHSIVIGVQMYAVENNDAYPDPSTVSSSRLASYINSWPTNPHTGLPMFQGTGPGDFSYSLVTGSDGLQTFTLEGYGTGGKVLISFR